MKTKLIYLLLWSFIILSFPLLLYLYISYKIHAYIYNDIKLLPNADYIVVLGSRGKTVEDRVSVAVELFRSGKGKKIIMSGDGDISGDWDYDETLAMKDIALAKGMRREDMILDPKGLRTLATCENLRDNIKIETEKVILVTQSWHVIRSVYACRSLGIESFGFTSDPGQVGIVPDRSYPIFQWYFSVFRDIIALNQMFLEVHFGQIFKFDLL